MDETKEKILISARKVISDKGYERASIKRIAIEAGVAPGLLHYHFKNKEDLLIQVMNSIYEGSVGPSALDQMGAVTPEQLASLITMLFREALKNSPDFFHLIYGTLNIIRQSEIVRKAMEEIWGRYRKETEIIIDRLKIDGAVTSSRSSAVILSLIVGVLHGIGIQAVGEPTMKLTESDDLWSAIEDNLLYILK